MATKPINAIVGPTTMRRVLKMSGLNASVVELSPTMSKKPMMINSPAIAMNIKLAFVNGREGLLFSSDCFIVIVESLVAYLNMSS